ncbi:IS200/IS605 family element transposase accessory protein TnpB [Methanolobus vulcani]|uniref:IS200/IS605 family element transposase accessory protein TnpB n=2 Tax=Methanolobus vulcani TaxID=38026 RepID=A0A7Z8KMR6_9EURY|nr:IS200/IS605 family element transposase accessory protein TnpB [Methanolobus vulcani]
MLKAYKYRLYPTKEQKEFFEKQFNACRFIYNWGLQTKIFCYEKTRQSLSHYELELKMVHELKHEHLWLKEVMSIPLIRTLINLDIAYDNFFRELKKDPHFSGFPRFKSKKNARQSFQFHQGYTVDFDAGYLKLPKIGNVECRYHRTFGGTPKTITISRNAGKYFVSITVHDGLETPAKQPYDADSTIGIDVGLTHFATLSNGEKIDNPKHLLKNIERVKVLNRRLSRKKKGSNNRKKAVQQLARLHEKIANQRRDFLHKVSHRLISENQAVAIEDLNIRDMQQNHHLAQAISDVSWFEFGKQLEYKAEWNGKTVLRIDKFEPSSKTCSNCGYKKENMPLSVREWSCPECGTVHDRDLNAALNIKNMALCTAAQVG